MVVLLYSNDDLIYCIDFNAETFLRHWLTTYVMKTPLPLVLCIILKPNLSLMLPFLSSTVMNLVGPELESDISQEIVTNIWWSYYKFLCNQNLDNSEDHYLIVYWSNSCVVLILN
jgi:hypothetical protein